MHIGIKDMRKRMQEMIAEVVMAAMMQLLQVIISLLAMSNSSIPMIHYHDGRKSPSGSR